MQRLGSSLLIMVLGRWCDRPGEGNRLHLRKHWRLSQPNLLLRAGLQGVSEDHKVLSVSLRRPGRRVPLLFQTPLPSLTLAKKTESRLCPIIQKKGGTSEWMAEVCDGLGGVRIQTKEAAEWK